MAGSKFIWSTLTTDTATTDVEGVGQIRWEGGNAYRWVENPVTNFTPGPGALVCHTFTDGTVSLNKISKPATATLGYLAGVACTTIAASTGTNPKRYGWIQVYGLNSSVAVTPVNTETTANPVAGNSLIGVNGQVWAATGQAMGTAPIYARKIELLDVIAAGTTTTTANCLIQCL